MPDYSLNSWVKLRVSHSNTNVDIANNRSTVNVTVQLVCTSSTGAYDGYNNTLKVTINGVQKTSQSLTYSFGSSGSKTVGTWSQVVGHDNNGSKSCRIQVSLNMVADTNANADYSVNLTPIPRATAPTLSSNSVALGSSITINLPRASNSFTHRIYYNFFSSSGLTAGISNATNAGTSATFTPPASLASSHMQNTSSNGCVIYVETRNGSTVIGTHGIGCTITVPNTAAYRPSLGSVQFEELNALVKNIVTYSVKSRSNTRVKTTFTMGTGASLSTASIKIGGTTHKATVSGSTIYVDNVPSSSGAVPVVISVTDSRGRVANSNGTWNITDYNPPSLTARAVRNPGNNTQVRYTISLAGTNLSSKNILTMNLYTRTGTGAWSASVKGGTSATGSLNWGTFVLGGYAASNTYEAKVVFTDSVSGNLEMILKIPTASVLMDAYLDQGVGIGKMYEPARGGSIQISGGMIVDDSIQLTGKVNTSGHITLDNNRFINVKNTSNAEVRAIHKGTDNDLHINSDKDGNTILWGDVCFKDNVVQPFTTYYTTNKAHTMINRTDNHTNSWNQRHNANLRLQSYNNALSIFVGGTSNDRNVLIQSGHADTGYASVVGNIHLNPLGGKVYMGGDLAVTGAKNALHVTRDGVRATPAYETAESYLGDIGENRTDWKGKSIIRLETFFKDIVNTTIPYQVFLQSYGKSFVWVEERNENSFVVKSSEPNTPFSWEIKAKRRGHEEERMVLQNYYTNSMIQQTAGLTGEKMKQEEEIPV